MRKLKLPLILSSVLTAILVILAIPFCLGGASIYDKINIVAGVIICACIVINTWIID